MGKARQPVQKLDTRILRDLINAILCDSVPTRRSNLHTLSGCALQHQHRCRPHFHLLSYRTASPEIRLHLNLLPAVRVRKLVELVPAVGGAAVVRVSTRVRIGNWFPHVLRAAELSVRLKAGLELDHALRNAAFR